MESPDDTALAERAYDKAVRYELDYGCCPQCVLATVQETVGIVDDQTIKASHALSGGGGLMGEGLCGALTGGLMALASRFGRDRDKLDQGRYMNDFKKAKELTERFRAEFGGVSCRGLQQRFTGRTYDMWDAAQYRAFDQARGNRCAHATGTVTRWVVEILQRP